MFIVIMNRNTKEKTKMQIEIIFVFDQTKGRTAVKGTCGGPAVQLNKLCSLLGAGMKPSRAPVAAPWSLAHADTRE